MGAEQNIDSANTFYSKLERQCLISQPEILLTFDINREELLMDAMQGALLTLDEQRAKKILRVYSEGEGIVPPSEIEAAIGYDCWALFESGNILYLKNGAYNMQWFRIMTYSLDGGIVGEMKFDDFSLDTNLCPGLDNPEDELGDRFKYHYVANGWVDMGLSEEGIIYILTRKKQTGTVGILVLDREGRRYNQGLLGKCLIGRPVLGIHGNDIFLLLDQVVYKTDGEFADLERVENLSRLNPAHILVGPGPRFFIPRGGPDVDNLGFMGVYDQEGDLLTFLGREKRYLGVVFAEDNIFYAKEMITDDDGLDILARAVVGQPLTYQSQVRKFRFSD